MLTALAVIGLVSGLLPIGWSFAQEGPHAGKLPASLELSRGPLKVIFHTTDGTFKVADSWTGQTWSQKPVGASLLVKDARASTEAIEADLVDPRTALEFTTRLRL